jgi:Bacteriophage related domain of unknown function
MAHPTVVAEVEARLAANWTATPIVPANTLGTTEGLGEPFVIVDYPVANSERSAVNDRLYREEGGFRILLYMPRGIGLTQGGTWSEALAAIFRDQKFGAGLALNTLAPDPPITDDASDEGNFFLFATIVPYVFEYRA